MTTDIATPKPIGPRSRAASRAPAYSKEAVWVSAGGRIDAHTHRRDGVSRERSLVYPDPKEADMPNGIFPVPPFDSRPSHTTDTRPSLAVRIRTWLRRNHLDEELAHGADPDTTAELNRLAALEDQDA
ncbi:MAG: hypothetical protein ACRDM7_23260 [Thermoleophilaceae bacterium]